MIETRWLVIAADGRHETLGRATPPSDDEVARCIEELVAENIVGAWFVTMTGAYWGRRCVTLTPIRALIPGVEWEAAEANFQALRRAFLPARIGEAASRPERKAPPDRVRETHDIIMMISEREWRRTENPIWVWRAIGGGAVRAGSGSPQFPLPAWCADYLRMVAHRIQALSEGQDWRVPTHEIPDDWTLPIRRLNHSRQIEPNAAMETIPMVLGLTKQGWNAFSIDAAAQAREAEFLRMAQLMGSEPSKAAARRAFMEETGRNDERSVRDLQRKTKEWLIARELRVFKSD